MVLGIILGVGTIFRNPPPYPAWHGPVAKLGIWSALLSKGAKSHRKQATARTSNQPASQPSRQLDSRPTNLRASKDGKHAKQTDQ